MQLSIPVSLTIIMFASFTSGRLCDAADYVAKPAGKCFECPNDAAKGFTSGAIGVVVDDYSLFYCR
jgi:hypothetical protein